jgi:hypothetical protein
MLATSPGVHCSPSADIPATVIGNAVSCTAAGLPTLSVGLFSTDSIRCPFAGEPRQVRLVPASCCLPLTIEERPVLGQDKGVGAALAPGLVTDRQLSGVNPGVDVPSALLGKRPRNGPAAAGTTRNRGSRTTVPDGMF